MLLKKSKMRKIDFLKYFFQFHFSQNRSNIWQRNMFETENVFSNYLPNNKIELKGLNVYMHSKAKIPFFCT